MKKETVIYMTVSNTHTIHKHLILQSQKGDQSAMSSLYGLYAKAMYNICRRMMGDEEEAKDLLQESFIDAFQKLPSLREVNTFSSWIKRIVVNNCINAIRKKKLDTSQLEEGSDFIEEEEDDFEYTHFQAGQIMQVINLLPEGCRTVLNLYLFEGYDHKEIGDILGVTESASKAQYCKAKARIRKLLVEERSQNAG
ncbi:MAG: sigma-70 family RNA polymerase sigma factor [Ekhidna sp.]|nr:sigma-70 family RNA polymerase sigma factor [Ekhidna sp.]